jgi:nitrite reductase/ring-hydroxylating ferredoxin subunit
VTALASLQARVFACSLDELSHGTVRVVRLTPDALGRPREALIVIDASQTPRAYLNLCRHLPVPLSVSRQSLKDGHLQCLTHGARYRLEDGLCVIGPCRGQALLSLELELIDRDLFVYEPSQP